MKDKIKATLTIALGVMNAPFYLVRLLITFIPIGLGYWLASANKNKDAAIHLLACMLEALWMSGPLGFLNNYCQHIWFDKCLNDDVNSFEKTLKDMFCK